MMQSDASPVLLLLCYLHGYYLEIGSINLKNVRAKFVQTNGLQELVYDDWSVQKLKEIKFFITNVSVLIRLYGLIHTSLMFQFSALESNIGLLIPQSDSCYSSYLVVV